MQVLGFGPASRTLRDIEGNQVMREIITLQCGDCKNRNYTTTKNKKKHSDRLETKKFCNSCRKHTAHKEVK